MDCRIDLNGGSESNGEGVANRSRSGTIFFASDPRLQVGHYLRWISRAGKPVLEPTAFRVTYVDDAEGRPGDSAWLWSVEASEDQQISSMLKAELDNG